MTRDKLLEPQSIFATALFEATEMKHPHAGSDHIFLEMLGMRYATSNSVLFRYEYLQDQARDIVRSQTQKWIFRKHGKTRLATSSPDFMLVKECLPRIALELDGSTAEPNALHVLAALLIVNAPNYADLLRKLKISPNELRNELIQVEAWTEKS